MLPSSITRILNPNKRTNIAGKALNSYNAQILTPAIGRNISEMSVLAISSFDFICIQTKPNNDGEKEELIHQEAIQKRNGSINSDIFID